MKKVISFLVLALISIYLVTCSKGNQQIKKEATTNEIIEIVYNQLPKELKDTIDFDLEKIKIDKYILKDGTGVIYDKSYIGKEVYDIEFIIKDKSVMPENRIVIATLDDYKVIGYGYVG